MKILYISSAVSPNEFPIMQSYYNKDGSDIYGMPEASFKFHNLIIEGMSENGAGVYSLIGRPISYSGYKKIFWRCKKEKEKRIVYHHVSVINLPIIKQLYVSIAMMFNIIWWLLKNLTEKEKTIIYDGAYVSLIPIISFCTLLFHCNKIPIICDIYGYMANVEDARGSTSKVKTILSKFVCYFISRMQGYVFLTEQMNEILNLNHKPYLVMEGISQPLETNAIVEKNKKFIIMYAGALKKEYGLQNLVNGFMKYKNKNAELWICGAGSYAKTIEKKSKTDKRIKFFGHLSMEEVHIKEQAATVLVNPRPTCYQFTQYSFPSKNMEYMSSGTPVLTTKLPGMPAEYYQYIYVINGNKQTDIVNSLNELSDLPSEELENKGKRAKEFILKNKNKKAQSKKILDLCNQLFDKKNSLKSDKNDSKILNGYFMFLLIMYVLFSRNTLYSSLILSTRISAMLLIFLSLPLFGVYLDRIRKKQISINNLILFIIMFSSIVLSLIIKRDFTFFNLNFLLTISSCYIYSQLQNDNIKFKKIYIIIMAIICIFSLFNQYIIKNILINLNLFNQIKGDFWIITNVNNVSFLNLISSFVVYVPNYIRNFGIFNEPSFFQFYLIVALLFVDQIKLSNIKKVLLIVLFVLTSISTLSTTSYILIILYSIMHIKDLFFCTKKILNCDSKLRKTILFLSVIIVSVGIILLFKNSGFLTSFKFVFKKLLTNNASSTTRMGSVWFALKSILQNPILGVNSTFYLNEHITTNTTGSIWAMYGLIPLMCFIIYTIKFSFNNNEKLYKKIFIFLMITLSLNSHFFLNNFSFWVILFSGIMDYIN